MGGRTAGREGRRPQGTCCEDRGAAPWVGSKKPFLIIALASCFPAAARQGSKGHFSFPRRGVAAGRAVMVRFEPGELAQTVAVSGCSAVAGEHGASLPARCPLSFLPSSRGFFPATTSSFGLVSPRAGCCPPARRCPGCLQGLPTTPRPGDTGVPCVSRCDVCNPGVTFLSSCSSSPSCFCRRGTGQGSWPLCTALPVQMRGVNLANGQNTQKSRLGILQASGLLWSGVP